jgi:hypothetical protein
MIEGLDLPQVLGVKPVLDDFELSILKTIQDNPNITSLLAATNT